MISKIKYDGNNIDKIIKLVVENTNSSISEEEVTKNCIPPTIIYYLNTVVNGKDKQIRIDLDDYVIIDDGDVFVIGIEGNKNWR